MRFLFKNSLLAQEAQKIADLVNYEAQKQKLKIKQVWNFSYSSNNQPTHCRYFTHKKINRKNVTISEKHIMPKETFIYFMR